MKPNVLITSGPDALRISTALNEKLRKMFPSGSLDCYETDFK
jgi:hypothetical protein